MKALLDWTQEAMRKMAGEIRPGTTMPAPVQRRVRQRQAGTVVAATAAVCVLVAVTVVTVDVLRPPHREPNPPEPAASPLSDLAVGWTELPAPPDPRPGMAYLWAGDRLLAWGGWAGAEESPTATGYVFGPTGSTWSPIRDAPLPGAGVDATWTGREAIFFGVGAERWRGEAFDPVAGAWRVIADPPIARRDAAMTVWTGSELIVWGGGSRTGPPDLSGAAYDPATDTWHRIADGPIGLNQGDAVWTGHQMVVVGSYLNGRNVSSTETAVGAEYDPATDRWHSMPPTSLSPQATSTVWVDHSLLAWDYEPRAQVGDVPVQPGGVSWGDVRPMPLDFSECYPDSAVIRNDASEVAFAWYCGEAALWDPTRALWSRVTGGPLDETIEAGVGSIPRWQFAEMAPIGQAVVLAAEAVTVSEQGEPCYGCPGAQHSMWAYRPPSNAPTSAEVAPPSFAAAPDWNTISTSPDPGQVEVNSAPTAWASTEAFSQRDLAGNTVGGYLSSALFPSFSLREMSPSGVFILVSTWGPAPRGLDEMTLPPQISDAKVLRNWEGQVSANVPEYQLIGAFEGKVLEVRVYFGAPDPSEATLALAQEQLDRLRVPLAP